MEELEQIRRCVMESPEVKFTYEWWLRAMHVRAGIIYISGPIYSGMAAVVMNEIMLAQSQTEHLEFWVNSPGGEIQEALAIHDLIRTTLNPKVVALGMAASAASMIVLQAGDQRLSLPNTRFMLHEISRMSYGAETTTQAQEAAREMRLLQERMLAVLAKRTGRTAKEISKAIGKKDLWLTAEEALEWGLIDRIMSKLPRL
jgi:ATP-dependent Clp protease protease subunit